MSAREVSTAMRRLLIDSIFEEGAYEDPSKLLVNPEADEKDWERKPAKARFVADSVKDFSADDLADILNDAAERWASWRISNMKASIRNKGRESALKIVEKVVLGAVSKYNQDSKNDSALVDALDSVGKAEILRILVKYRIMVPKHPLLAK